MCNVMETALPKKFVYIPPTPPTDLTDSTSFTIDFAGRKFLQVGIDPTCDLTIVILIITPARHRGRFKFPRFNILYKI